MATPYNDQWRLERWSDIAAEQNEERGSAARIPMSARVRTKPRAIRQAHAPDVAMRSYFLLRRWPCVSRG
jgi:hypothetical protein